MRRKPGPRHDQRGGEGSGHRQNGKNYTVLAGPGASEDMMGAGLGHIVLPGLAGSWVWAQRRGFPPAGMQQRYPPTRKPSSRSAHPDSVCWWCQPARAAGASSPSEDGWTDGRTRWAGQVKMLGLQMAWKPRWARRLRCQLRRGALESSCCQLGGGDSPRSPLWGWLGRSSVTRAVLAVRIRPQQAEGGRGARCCGKRAWKPSKRADTIR